jgi:acetyl esterase
LFNRNRRDVIAMAATSLVGLPMSHMKRGDPSARFNLVVSEVELRRNRAGRMLMAIICQLKGTTG